MVIHDKFGVVVAIVAAVGAIAAIIALLRPAVLPAVRVYLRLTAAVVAVQVLVGIVLVATGSRPSQGLHWFYGAATLLALPLAMWIGSRLGRREEPLWVMGGAVATLLFAFRAIGTG
jgi:heme A synthase